LLWGAVDSLLEEAGTSLDEIDAQARERFEPAVRLSLGTSRFEAAAGEGRRLSLEQLVQRAIAMASESARSER
jgi:hypothetical protein